MMVVGIGARAGVPEAELVSAVEAGLAAAGLLPAAITALATLDRRAGEGAVHAVADRFGWRLIGFAAADLAAVEVPHPSAAIAAKVGSPSVAEAAALRAAASGAVVRGAVLVRSKRVFARVTVAIAGS